MGGLAGEVELDRPAAVPAVGGAVDEPAWLPLRAGRLGPFPPAEDAEGGGGGGVAAAMRALASPACAAPVAWGGVGAPWFGLLLLGLSGSLGIPALPLVFGG